MDLSGKPNTFMNVKLYKKKVICIKENKSEHFDNRNISMNTFRNIYLKIYDIDIFFQI